MEQSKNISANPQGNLSPSGPTKNIVDTAIAAGNFTTLVASIRAAGLTDTLTGKGPFRIARANRSRDDGEIDKTSLLRRAINALAGLGIVLGLRMKDALHKFLRIAIVKRKPARLDLHHYPVSRQENMIRMRQF